MNVNIWHGCLLIYVRGEELVTYIKPVSCIVAATGLMHCQGNKGTAKNPKPCVKFSPRILYFILGHFNFHMTKRSKMVRLLVSDVTKLLCFSLQMCFNDIELLFGIYNDPIR